MSSKENQSTLEFHMGRELADEIDSRLYEARKRGDYTHVKGGIAEELCAGAFELCGWIEVRRHPFAIRTSYMAANVYGPDGLMKSGEGQRLALFEFKWWLDNEAAYRQGLEQFAGPWRHYRTYMNQRIDGAFIVLLDLEPKETKGEIHVRRVW